MSVAFYTGGHSLADLIRDLYQLYHSLAKVQDALAELIISGEIVPLEELAPGWYLEWASAHESGEGWVRFGGRKIMIVVDGKPRDPAKLRYHSPFSEPRPPTPSEPVIEEAPSQPDADPPSTTIEEDPPANAAALLPSGRWHILAVVLEGWRQGKLSTPLMQEYFARLVENGAIKLSEALPEGWMLSSQRFGGVTGKTYFSFIAPGGKELWADEIGCQLSDPRILDPRLLHLFLAPAVVETPPNDDTDSPSEEQSEGQPQATPETDGRELAVWKETLIPLLNALRDGHQLPNINAAYHAVDRCLTGRGQPMSKSSIYEGLNRHHAEWWSPPVKK
jgi:hypothetical protein